MMQLGLGFAPVAIPPAIESRENDNGILVDYRAITLYAKERGRPKLAEIRLAYAAGQWHWGISIATSSFGVSFAPAKKWRHSTSACREAVEDAAAFILARIDSSASVSGGARGEIAAWIRRVLSGEVMPS